MTTNRSLAIALAALGIGAPQAQAQKEAQNGPKTSIYARSSGGLTNRDVQANFKVDRDAYVLVGHLGGDGIIRILYPESPSKTGKTKGGRWTLTHSVPAYYDAIPSLYAHTPVAYRSNAARINSYDGLGHGFVFVISSHNRLDWEEITETRGSWEEFEVSNYTRVYDPRVAVRDFADFVAGAGQYTLEFATSFRTVAFTSYADAAWDCSVLSTLSYSALASLRYASMWSFSPSSLGFGSRGFGCGRRFGYFDYYPRQRYYHSGQAVDNTTPFTPPQPQRRIVRTEPRVEPGRTRMNPRTRSGTDVANGQSSSGRSGRERIQPRGGDSDRSYEPVRARTIETTRPAEPRVERSQPQAERVHTAPRTETVRTEPARSDPPPPAVERPRQPRN